MSTFDCPKCNCDYAYHDGICHVCPECGYEWHDDHNTALDDNAQVYDANGTLLADGDTVTLIKALKLKGSSQTLKQGTKVKQIRLVPNGDHNIDCKIDGIALMLKSEFVKKS